MFRSLSFLFFKTKNAKKKKIIKYKIQNTKKGVRGLWAGLTPNIMRAFLVNAAEIGSYDHAKHTFIERGWLNDGMQSHLGASFVAGLFFSSSIFVFLYFCFFVVFFVMFF